MSEEEIKQLAEKELVDYLKGRDFGLCPTSKYYMANHIEEIIKSANATKELEKENELLRKRIEKYKDELKKVRVAFIQAQAMALSGGKSFEDIIGQMQDIAFGVSN